jgi:hypothetical protein
MTVSKLPQTPLCVLIGPPRSDIDANAYIRVVGGRYEDEASASAPDCPNVENSGLGTQARIDHCHASPYILVRPAKYQLDA